MGRPLNKRHFGPPTDDGLEIKVQFNNGTASVNGWIVRQTGSKRFICSDGSTQVKCYLVPKNSGDLLANEMSITVKDDAGNVYQVSKIAANRVTLETGATIAWNWSDSTTDGYAEMEEAGGDVIAVTAAVNGTEYVIVTLGNTVWATFDAGGDNSPYAVGDTFVMANAPGTGTGTVRVAGDDFEGDE
jgi:hypothetical protein